MASAVLQHKLCNEQTSNLYLSDVISQDKLLRKLRTKAKKEKSASLINDLQKVQSSLLSSKRVYLHVAGCVKHVSAPVKDIIRDLSQLLGKSCSESYPKPQSSMPLDVKPLLNKNMLLSSSAVGNAFSYHVCAGPADHDLAQIASLRLMTGYLVLLSFFFICQMRQLKEFDE